MLVKQLMEAFELLDSPKARGAEIVRRLRDKGAEDLVLEEVTGEKGSTDFIKVRIRGERSKEEGGEVPTLGIIGRLGGVGARPEKVGFVSGGDGAVVALTIAFKLLESKEKGDLLPGDVIISTHVCPHAPTKPHDPVPFMDSPVDIETMNRYELDQNMNAVLSIDTTKGNNIINERGFAITPTVKEGYILKTSEDLLRIMSVVTGKPPRVMPITTQDITPYSNDLFHINSIMQPATATSSPVVGVGITAEVPVPGCASGASHFVDLEVTARFCIEVAKEFCAGQCVFYDEKEFGKLVELYGSMKHLQG